MMIKRLFASLILANVMIISVAHARCDFDDFPVMDDMFIQSVMEDALYNDRPMMVRSFTTEASYHEVVSHYHRIWDKRYDDTAFGIWHQITTMTSECMMTVQVTDASSELTNGRLIISNPPSGRSRKNVGEDVLAPTDSVVVSDLSTVDGSKHGRVTMLSSEDSTRDVASFYRSTMPSSGWTLDSQFSEQDAMVLVFRKGANTRNVVIVPTDQGRTQILINEETLK
jgi:hypothetical protein